MKYTIEPEAVAIHASLREADGSRRLVKVARLLHLPNATQRTAAMFGRYSQNSWEEQPEYATFSTRPGSPVIAWRGKIVEISTKQQLETLQVGSIHHNSLYTNTGQVAQVITLELEKAI